MYIFAFIYSFTYLTIFASASFALELIEDNYSVDMDKFNYLNNLKDSTYNEIEFKIDEINNKFLKSDDKEDYLLGIMFITNIYYNSKFLLNRKNDILRSIRNRVFYEIDKYEDTDFDVLSASTVAFSLIGNNDSIQDLYDVAVINSQNLYDPSKFEDYIKYTLEDRSYQNNNIVENRSLVTNFSNVLVEPYSSDYSEINPYDVFIYKSSLHIQFTIHSIGNILTEKSANYLYKLAVYFYDSNKDFFNLCVSYL